MASDGDTIIPRSRVHDPTSPQKQGRTGIRERLSPLVRTFSLFSRAQSAFARLAILAAFLMASCGGAAPGAPAPQTTDQAPLAATSITIVTSPAPSSAAPSPFPPTPLSAVSPRLDGAQAAQAAATYTPPPVPAGASTAACQKPAALTPAVTEGPYFKANSPERSSLLETGMSGTPLALTGYIFTTDCQPVEKALLDFWQANAQGQYDNAGFTLRGHQYTDAAGRYHLDTVVPGLYPGRTEHIHVKVQAPNGPVLTTQLFFPGSTENQSDQFYNPALLIHVQSSGSQMQATFDFVVSAP